MHTSEAVLALDSGSQSSRALLFDLFGQVLAVGRCDHAPMKHPVPGAVEQDPHDIRDALFAAIRDCLTAWEGDPARIVGAALTTQRGTVLPLDENQAPLADAVSWLDRRVATVADEPSPVLRTALKTMGEKALIPRLLAKSWPRRWRQENPTWWPRLARIVPIEGWLNLCLTDRPAVAPGGLPGAWPYDVKTFAWSSSALMLGALGYQRDWLPPIVQPADPVGSITAETAGATGLPEGLPVYACGGDKQAEAFGAGLTSASRGVAAVSLGTGSSICVPWPKPVVSRRYDWFTLGAAEPGAYCLEYLVFRGMWTVRWFVRELARDLLERAMRENVVPEALLCTEAEAVPAGSDGLAVWPRWSPTLQHPLETGVAAGLRETHTRGHFFRALLEGIAYDLRRGLETLEKATGEPIRELTVGGGGSRSPVVVRILADVTGRPVRHPSSEELAARGAAMVAALGAGRFGHPSEAIAAMVPSADRIEPDPQTKALYERLYRQVYLPGLIDGRRVSTRLAQARHEG